MRRDNHLGKRTISLSQLCLSIRRKPVPLRSFVREKFGTQSAHRPETKVGLVARKHNMQLWCKRSVKLAKKPLYSDKVWVVACVLQVRRVCGDAEVFCPSGQIFKHAANSGWNLNPMALPGFFTRTLNLYSAGTSHLATNTVAIPVWLCRTFKLLGRPKLNMSNPIESDVVLFINLMPRLVRRMKRATFDCLSTRGPISTCGQNRNCLGQNQKTTFVMITSFVSSFVSALKTVL